MKCQLPAGARRPGFNPCLLHKLQPVTVTGGKTDGSGAVGVGWGAWNWGHKSFPISTGLPLPTLLCTHPCSTGPRPSEMTEMTGLGAGRDPADGAVEHGAHQLSVSWPVSTAALGKCRVHGAVRKQTQRGGFGNWSRPLMDNQAAPEVVSSPSQQRMAARCRGRGGIPAPARLWITEPGSFPTLSLC